MVWTADLQITRKRWLFHYTARDHQFTDTLGWGLCCIRHNTWQVYFRLYGEYNKLGLLRYSRPSPDMQGVLEGIRRTRRKYSSTHGEYGKRILPYSTNLSKDIHVKLRLYIISENFRPKRKDSIDHLYSQDWMSKNPNATVPYRKELPLIDLM
jgi:hypothetical protein